MLLEDLREQLQALASAVAAEEGLEVWDLTLARGRRGWQVRLFVDRATGAVSVGECASANQRVRSRLELERLLEGDFDLEVSSPGIDRPLRSMRDVERFKGYLARVKVRGETSSAVIIGRIVAVAPEGFELDTEEGRRAVPWVDVLEARLEPELPGFPKGPTSGKKSRGSRGPRVRR